MEDRQHLERLGRAVRRRRGALGYSQEELAERAGLHRNYVGGVERGERNVGYLNLVRLSQALEWSLAEFVAEAEAIATR